LKSKRGFQTKLESLNGKRFIYATKRRWLRSDRSGIRGSILNTWTNSLIFQG
jgi:hypothetical protein